MANTAIIIVGQCRSGTSLCAGILHQLGCDMGGAGQIGPYNPKGNFSDSTFDYLIRCIQADSTDTASKVKLAAYLKQRDKLTTWGVKHWLLASSLITWMTTNLSSQIKVVYTSRNLMDSANSLNALRGGNGVANANDIAFIQAQQTWIANAQQPGGALYGLPSMTVSYPNIFIGAGSSGSISGSLALPSGSLSGSVTPVGPTQLVADLAAFAGLPNRPGLAAWIDSSLQQQSVALAAHRGESLAKFNAPQVPPANLSKPRPMENLPCANLGRRVIGLLAPDTVRVWHQCEKGHGVVCVCSCGVNTSCVDYDSGENE